MPSKCISCCIVYFVSVVVVSPALIAQTVDLRVVQINDMVITPTTFVSVRPGDSFVVEATVSGGAIASTLKTFQITIPYAEDRCPGYPFDPIYPKGLPAAPPYCSTSDDCVEPVPECRDSLCVRPCEDDSDCVLNLPRCFGGICVGIDPGDFERYNYFDRERPDALLPASSTAICASIATFRAVAWGCAVVDGPYPPYDGSPKYAGTLTFEVGFNVCGPLELGQSVPVDNFLIIRTKGTPLDRVLNMTLASPLRIDIERSYCDFVTIKQAIPGNWHTLPRVRNNAVKLVTNGPAGAHLFPRGPIYELNDQTCLSGVPSSEDRLNSLLSFDFGDDPVGFDQYTLIQDETSEGLFQHGRWYRFTGLEPPTGGCNLDYCVLVGDADDNGMVNFADLVTIHQGIPTVGADPTDRRDINGDGFVNFADLVVAYQHVGSIAPPHPCP